MKGIITTLKHKRNKNHKQCNKPKHKAIPKTKQPAIKYQIIITNKIHNCPIQSENQTNQNASNQQNQKKTNNQTNNNQHKTKSNIVTFKFQTKHQNKHPNHINTNNNCRKKTPQQTAQIQQ